MTKCSKCNKKPIFANNLCSKCWAEEQSDKLDRIESLLSKVRQTQEYNGITPYVVNEMNKRGLVPDKFWSLNEEQRIELLTAIKTVVKSFNPKNEQ